MPWYERDYNRGGSCRPCGGGLSRQSVVLWLLGINSVLFLLDMLLGGSRRADWLAPSYYGAFSIGQAVHGLQLWRWVTYQFLHADFLHLLFNMIGLYYFGPRMEQWWGSRRFLAFYLLCGLSGAVLFTLLALVPGVLHVGPSTTLVGASGSLFGILVGCALLYPHDRVMLMFPPIPMTLRTLALVFLGISALSLLAGSRAAGGDAAHLGGAALGYLLVRNPHLLRFAERRGPGPLLATTAAWRRRRVERQRRGEAHDIAEVDRILDKVRQHGLHRLSGREKKVLRRATDRQRRAG